MKNCLIFYLVSKTVSYFEKRETLNYDFLLKQNSLEKISLGSLRVNYYLRKVRFYMHLASHLGDTNSRSNARVFGRKFVCRRCAPAFSYLDAIKLRRLILSISEPDSLSALVRSAWSVDSRCGARKPCKPRDWT